jgi:predicted acyltransferase
MPGTASGRLRSLDVFRGATIAGMILVNNPGDGRSSYAPLLHAEWHGWTPTDLVFPFFLFAVGVAIPLAFARRLEAAAGERGPLYRQIVRRTLILLALGLVLNWFPFIGRDWATARLPGVLQRIAVVYLCASLAFLHLRTRGRLVLSAALLSGYWLALKLVPVPGYGAGDLSAAGNLAGYVDGVLLGAHVWRHAPGPADPEGILSTLPAVVSALAGTFVGEWLRSGREARDKLIGLFVWGCLLLTSGLALAGWMPLNKNLWTSTYVLFTTGFALLVLAVAYHFVDLRGRGGWALPFDVFGKNSILAFVGSGLMARLLGMVRWQGAAGETVTAKSWLYGGLLASWLPDSFASLVWALLFVAVWLGLMGLLYRRKIFIRI